MPTPGPIAVRLPRAFALGRYPMARVVSRVVDGVVRPPLGAYRLHPRELWFARAVLLDHTRLWLWRTHQQRRAGDFVLVDMSEPVPDRRRAWVVDLKLHAPLRLGGGGAGIQLTNAALAMRALESTGVVSGCVRPVLATGAGPTVLDAIVGGRRVE